METRRLPRLRRIKVADNVPARLLNAVAGVPRQRGFNQRFSGGLHARARAFTLGLLSDPYRPRLTEPSLVPWRRVHINAGERREDHQTASTALRESRVTARPAEILG